MTLLSLSSGEMPPLTATQWKGGEMSDYNWVRAEVQTPHIVSTDTTKGEENGGPCYSWWG